MNYSSKARDKYHWQPLYFPVANLFKNNFFREKNMYFCKWWSKREYDIPSKKYILDFHYLAVTYVLDRLINGAIHFFKREKKFLFCLMRSLKIFLLFLCLKNLFLCLSTSLEQIKQLNFKILYQIFKLKSFI